MGTSQYVYEMVQGSLGRTRHQVHGAGSTCTLTKRQPLPRRRLNRSATLTVQGVLFGFRVWDVPRSRARSFPYPNHALDKFFAVCYHLFDLMLSWMLSKVNFTSHIRPVTYKHTIISQTLCFSSLLCLPVSFVLTVLFSVYMDEIFYVNRSPERHGLFSWCL